MTPCLLGLLFFLFFRGSCGSISGWVRTGDMVLFSSSKFFCRGYLSSHFHDVLPFLFDDLLTQTTLYKESQITSSNWWARRPSQHPSSSRQMSVQVRLKPLAISRLHMYCVMTVMRIWHQQGLCFIFNYIFPSSYRIAFYLSAQSTIWFVQASRHQKTNPINERTNIYAEERPYIRHPLVTFLINWTISETISLFTSSSSFNLFVSSAPSGMWRRIFIFLFTPRFFVSGCALRENKKSPYEQQQCNEDWVILWAEQLGI